MSISSAEASPNLSPAHSPTLGRRLSSRRGSVSASDPFGTYAPLNLNPSRSSSSRLTIVRVPQADGDGNSGRNHRRHGSNASVSSTSSKGEGNRLSFAFSSFTPVNPTGGGGGRPASPSSPRLRPSSPGGFNSPTAHHRGSMSSPKQAKLSPEKLVELAKTSCNPRPSISNVSGSVPSPASVSFTPLPDDVYLPFIDRPSEVASLISTSPTAKLFALLSQTFPPDARAPASASPDAGTPSVDSDPKKWTFAELENWLKRVPREEVNDATWVRKARQCIQPRTELIWERIKGALGVPPELDTDEEEQPIESYPLPRSPIAIPRVKLDSTMLDSEVFEPDSPVVASTSSHFINAPGSPSDSDLEISIEPVVPSAPPPPSAVDPTTGANMTSLQEIGEEDEDETEDDNTKNTLSASLDVQGLRISTSPSLAPFSPGVSPSGVGSVGSGRGFSPGPRRMSEGDGAYDALSERGPGHPLFPSSFAHLSMKPTLRSGNRSNSLPYPPLPDPALRRKDSSGAQFTRRPDWARSWDPSRYEHAVTTGSVSAIDAPI